MRGIVWSLLGLILLPGCARVAEISRSRDANRDGLELADRAGGTEARGDATVTDALRDRPVSDLKQTDAIHEDGAKPGDAKPGELSCSPPLTPCGTKCVNLQTDPLFCGACNTPCPPATVPCQASACSAAKCTTGPVADGTPCADALSCTSGEVCSAGTCKLSVSVGHCAIDGQCYLAGTAKNACLICEPATSQVSWVGQAVPGCVVTVAGSGSYGYLDGAALQAKLKYPVGLALGNSGTVYFSDSANHRIRKLASGQVSTVAGAGSGFLDGPAGTARFNTPEGLALSNNMLYVADSANNRIRAVDLTGNTVFTVAGSGAGFQDGSLLSALFNQPRSIAVMGPATFLIADSLNHRVRMIDGSNVSTHAGAGTQGFLDGPAGSALFDTPYAVAATAGVGYVAEKKSNRIRRIASNVVSTVAGSSSGFLDGPLTASKFAYPFGVAISSTTGNLVVADFSNQRVRLINLGTSQVSTLAGSGTAGFADGLVGQAQFNGPWNVAVDGAKVYVTDYNNHRIRMIVLATPP